MYVIPLIAIMMIALAIFFSPILAAILFVVLLIGLAAYKFLGRGGAPASGEGADPVSSRVGPGAARESSAEETGAWGEQWPEQRSDGEP